MAVTTAATARRLVFLAWVCHAGACTGTPPPSPAPVPTGAPTAPADGADSALPDPAPGDAGAAMLDDPEERSEDRAAMLDVVNDKGEFSDPFPDAGAEPALTDAAWKKLGAPSPDSAQAAPQERVRGDLDRSIIRRYVQGMSARIRHCYTAQLRKRPGLQGTVVVTFQIGADGRVASASARGVHAEVASCVRDAILGIQFPRVPDGGVVDVQYPFTFRPPRP